MDALIKIVPFSIINPFRATCGETRTEGQWKAVNQKNSHFSNLQVKQKFGSKNRIIREIRSKITVLTEERQTAFDSSYLEVKKEGSRNRDSTVFPKYLEWSA